MTPEQRRMEVHLGLEGQLRHLRRRSAGQGLGGGQGALRAEVPRHKLTTHNPVSRRPARPRVPCPRRSARPRSPTWPGSAAAGRAAPGSPRRVQPPRCCTQAKEQRCGPASLAPAPPRLRPNSPALNCLACIRPRPPAPNTWFPRTPQPTLLSKAPCKVSTSHQDPAVDSRLSAVPPSPAHLPGPTRASSSAPVTPPPGQPSCSPLFSTWVPGEDTRWLCPWRRAGGSCAPGRSGRSPAWHPSREIRTGPAA